MKNETKIDIKIIALSSHLEKRENLNDSTSVMENKDYINHIKPDVFAPTLFCANTDKYRLQSLIDSMSDERYKVIWCIRGGYGSARIIQELTNSLEHLKIKPQKIFIGFSDTTAIHLFLHQNLNWQTIHGLNYNQISDSTNGKIFSKANFDILDKILKNSLKFIEIDDLVNLNQTAQISKNINGNITGGNLSLLQTSIGTNWEINTKDKILIIEDVFESAAYRIDRMLEHLYQANKLSNAKAIVFGEFHECGRETDDALKRIANLLDNHNIPVFKTQMIGHGYHNYPFIYGAPTTIIKYNIENTDEAKFIMKQKVIL